MPMFEANMRVVRDERWVVEAFDIEGARRKFQLGTEDVENVSSPIGQLADWEVYAVTEMPPLTKEQAEELTRRAT